jgi:hypothetical protein
MNRLRESPHQQVFFEGGLGSQLLALIEYQVKMELFDGRVFVNLDYYSIDQKRNKRAAIRPWRLQPYGFTLHFFEESNKRANLMRDVVARPTILQHANFLLDNNIFNRAQTANIVLPDKIEDCEISELVLKETDFGSIHLRRGDYRKVASHLVSLTQVLSHLRRDSDYLPRTLFFFTDSMLRPLDRVKLKRLFRKLERRIILVEGTKRLSDIEVHGVMRKSKYLVVSNSTFSFSAALLRTRADSKVYVPSIFNLDEAAAMNSVYTSITSFGQY